MSITASRYLLVAILAGCAASLAVGVYGGLHQPTGRAINLAGFSSPGHAKSWLATVAVGLVLVQVATARGMWGRWGPTGQRLAPPVHRWSGRLALLCLLPVAVHCLYALGLAYGDPRVLVHSLAGCFVFGALTTKLLVVPRHDLPSRTLPIVGGLLAVTLTIVWLTSALWFFTTVGVGR